MVGYFKRFFIGHFLILIIAVCISFYIGPSGLVAIFVLLFEFLIYFLDLKYLSKRKTELANKLIEIFKAEPVSEGVMKFKIDTFDLFVEIEVDFKLGLQIANVETVRFHIPRNQIDRLSTKPGLELKFFMARRGKMQRISDYKYLETETIDSIENQKDQENIEWESS